MIKFILNGTWITESEIDPSLSILRYLRTRKGLTATKEGCASGDCGACTVLVGSVCDGQAQYQAVNSCITLLGDMHGKHIVTLDGLNLSNGCHPVQQCMVEAHGSQCGFCTPGIVMSLVGLREREHEVDREAILEALSGNLCRCTGYRPIVEAAQQSFEMDSNDNVINQTQPWDISEPDSCPSLHDAHTNYFAPQTEQNLKALLADNDDVRFVAGATDLALDITQQYQQPNCLISLSNVRELNQFDEREDQLVIGGSATYSSVMPWLTAWYPEVVELFERIGSFQIRNRGTIGGNIANASPIGDTPPVLLALDASVELASVHASRVVALSTFFINYKQTLLQQGEYIREIRIPKPLSDSHLKLYKLSKRCEDDISAVMAAFYFEIKQGIVTTVRLAFGGMAATPKYAEKTQQALLGQPWTRDTIEAAMPLLEGDFEPMSDVRASNQYRLKSAQNLLLKAFIEIDEQCEIEVFQHA